MHSWNGYLKSLEGKVPLTLFLTQELLEDLFVYSKNIVYDFDPRNSMKIIKNGYGAAKKDVELPNLLRVNLIENGEKTKKKSFNKYCLTTNKRDLNLKKIGIIRTSYKDNGSFQPSKKEKNDNFYIKLNQKYLISSSWVRKNQIYLFMIVKINI